MDFVSSRRTALAVLLAVVLIATPLGAVRSLNKIAASVADMFYSGVEIEDGGSTYTSQSIDELLTEKLKAAMGLITCGANYELLADETQALRDAREALASADTVSAKYAANEALESAWRALYDALEATRTLGDTDYWVTGDDLENARAYADTLEKVQGSISINRYNDRVAEFCDVTLARFPANLFGSLVTLPEYFGA